jgi:hypothetical protein
MHSEHMRIEKGTTGKIQRRMTSGREKPASSLPATRTLYAVVGALFGLAAVVTVWWVVVLASDTSDGVVATNEATGSSTSGLTTQAECSALAKLAVETAGSIPTPLAPAPDAPRAPPPSVAAQPRNVAKPEPAEVAHTAVRVAKVQTARSVEDVPAMDERHAQHWKRLELSGDGRITVEELAAQMHAPESAGRIFNIWDKNKDGVVTREEFIRTERLPGLTRPQRR